MRLAPARLLVFCSLTPLLFLFFALLLPGLSFGVRPQVSLVSQLDAEMTPEVLLTARLLEALLIV